MPRAADELIGAIREGSVGEVELYVGTGRTVILLGSIGWLDPFTGGDVRSLGERPDPHEVVAAVRSAPDASGFVLRER